MISIDKIPKEELENLVKDLASKVEEVSELKCNLEEGIVQSVNGIVKNTGVVGQYDPLENKIFISEKMECNEKWELEKIIIHELAHNAQFSNYKNLFPRFKKEIIELYLSRKGLKYLLFKSPGDRINYIQERSLISNLIEGDATLINLKILKKDYKIVSVANFSDRYLKMANILEKKFGDNRKEINQLYLAPIKELYKIFREGVDSYESPRMETLEWMFKGIEEIKKRNENGPIELEVI